MNWTHFEISLTLCSAGKLFDASCDSKLTASAVLIDGMFDFSILYDFSEIPLHLNAPARIGDTVKIVILPYRLELYINGRLCDEEWCCGAHFFGAHTLHTSNCRVDFSEHIADKHPLPSVSGTFQNAEGWKPEENVFVGDCMPYCHDGIYHVLYLKDRHHHRSKWGKGAHQWNHISSSDFINWNIHPMAIEIDDPREGSICTGSWIYNGEKHYLYYAVRMCDASPARICRSISEDGFHFEKDRSFMFTLSSRYNVRSARDPKVFRDAQGIYHMLLTTSLLELGRGCIAHLISCNLTEWQELDEPIFIAPEGMGEPECPDYFFKDGYYYLVYSLRGKGYYLYSRNPFTDWQIPDQPIIPCKSVPKAAVWQNRLIFSGFDSDGRYAGTMTFMEAVVRADGQLAYQKLDSKGSSL